MTTIYQATLKDIPIIQEIARVTFPVTYRDIITPEQKDFTDADFRFAQSHLLILSFLYGMLRPLDMIHPYRLEGKVKLEAAGGKNLFTYWKDKLTDLLIRRVQKDDGILLHLATEEFEHLFNWKRVVKEVHVIKPYFYVDKGNEYKIVSMYAKGCRGAMAR